MEIDVNARSGMKNAKAIYVLFIELILKKRKFS
jgi:hypothetical protein